MYFKKNLKSLVMLGIALAVILVSSFFGSMIQSRGWSIEVTDLRDAENTGAFYDPVDGLAPEGVEVKGVVKSGILYRPKAAHMNNKLPAVVLTHGYLNNREHQLPNAVELARRGFVVLTIDREGHGNYENEHDTGALMATNGLYDAVKYVYNLPYVDKAKIGISGHSMGGYTTAMTLYQDSTESVYPAYMTQLNAAIKPDVEAYTAELVLAGKTEEEIAAAVKAKTGLLTMAYMEENPFHKFVSANYRTKGTNFGIISAGLMQGWSTFIYADSDVDVGMLKAQDDEFFFTSKDVDGNPTICRQYLQSVGAAGFVGDNSYKETKVIDIKNGGIYVKGKLVEAELGQQVDGAFRVVYEDVAGIHPTNHFSVESTSYVVDFFYKAFGTPRGFEAIKTTNQVWVLKEIMATLGWVGIIFMIFPLLQLLFTVPFFAELRKRRYETADGRIAYEDVDEAVEAGGASELKGLRKHLSFWIPAVACTLFAGFSIAPIQEWAGGVFEQSALFPQDTTGWVALWSVCCGLFALTMVLLTNLVNRIINVVVYREDAAAHHEDVLGVARIGSVSRFLKTALLAAIVVVAMYLVLFANWAVWKVDFRFWTFCMKVFEVDVMLPTILRYSVFFGIFYVCNAICNQSYRVKNLPEWATIAINAFFNVAGIALVFAIQYGTFCSTGEMWKPEMNLSYIVLFPIIPVLVVATIISRVLYKKTGNIWLGALINTLLWTAVTVSGTAASFGYIMG